MKKSSLNVTPRCKTTMCNSLDKQVCFNIIERSMVMFKGILMPYKEFLEMREEVSC